MTPSLPVLVTRLSDRSALTRLVRAALRHEVAQVELAEAPPAGPQTLDLRLAGAPSVSIVAELAGAPSNGHFPLRLRPLHRAQAAELYALLDESPSSSRTDPADTAPTGSGPPDTLSAPQTLAYEDRGAPARARAESLRRPTPLDPRVNVTARLDARSDPRVAPRQSPLDLRRTARSLTWDPKRAGPTAEAWSEAARGAEAEDPSVSRSVIVQPHLLPPEVKAATTRAIAGAQNEASWSGGHAPAEGPETPHDDDTTQAFVTDEATEQLVTSSANELFFDDALANLSMTPPSSGSDEELRASSRASSAPVTDGRPPTFTPLPEPMLADPHDDFDTLVRSPISEAPGSRPAVVPAAGRPARTDVHAPVVDAEDLTPTDLGQLKKLTTGVGGRKKTTRRREKRPPSHRHPADAEATTAEVVSPPSYDQTSPWSSRGMPAAADVEEGDPLVGRKIAEGKYAIESAIGSGAAGAVYKATHRELRRTVALKVLHPRYQQDPHFMKSFRGEALAASQLDHPNVMRVLDFGQEPDGLVYIVMEFLSGRTLQSLLDEERRLQTDRAIEIMIQVCAALSVAHDNGIIHRDIKPDNIMLVPSRNDEGGTFELVKVCDFGIAALENPTRDDADLVGLHDNIIAGTPEYMSPEQARGTEIDARADVYAAGICLYELLTGRPPFIAESPAEILAKQIDEKPRPPSELLRGLDPIVEEVILRAIQKEPGKRQPSARELRVELKELINPGEAGGAAYDDERSIVENVPVLDDPASGFAGFFIALASAVLRFGFFERGHPEAPQAQKELLRATRLALRGRRELTFARRDSAKALAFCVITGTGELVDLRRLLGSQLFGSFGYPFIESVAKKGIAAITLREGIADTELQALIELLLAPRAEEELRNELGQKSLRYVSVLFGADVVGRDRKLSWKVGLCTTRLVRDLRALSNLRGLSLKKMRESREDLVADVAQLLTKGDEIRQFLFNSDLVDDAVANLRGFSGFHVGLLAVDCLLPDPCAEAVMLLIEDFDRGTLDQEMVRGTLRRCGLRLLGERSPRSDAAVIELYRRAIVTDAEVPRDLQEQMRAQALADALTREPLQFLRTLDFIQDPVAYERELAALEAAMAVLARRGEAGPLLAAIGVLARHAKGSGKLGPRENHALRTMKTMIDRHRLVPIANALLSGPVQQREAARQLLVLAGSAGAYALYTAREGSSDPNARPLFVQTFRETGPAGWALLSTTLPHIEVHNEHDIAFVEDLLRTMPERFDAALGDAVAKFLMHPRLRPAALAAIVPLWGERAKKPLLDALEFAEEPARIIAVNELRRLRAIDDAVVNVIERLLTMKGSASDEVRAAVAGALADVGPSQRARAVTLLAKGVEGKRGFVAMLRGDGASEEGLLVTESMARALLALDRNEGLRAVRGRLSKADPRLKARLTALLQMA